VLGCAPKSVSCLNLLKGLVLQSDSNYLQCVDRRCFETFCCLVILKRLVGQPFSNAYELLVRSL